MLEKEIVKLTKIVSVILNVSKEMLVNLSQELKFQIHLHPIKTYAMILLAL